MIFDLVIENAAIDGQTELVDIGIVGDTIQGIGKNLKQAKTRFDACGCYAFSGFVDCHIHLDKAGISGRCTICEGTLAEAVRETAKAKAAFTEEDVYERAKAVVERAITFGTSAMRSFVEIDPRAGFRSFEAIKKIKNDYAWAIDLQICAFAQEGLTQELQTLAMLDEALSHGADLIGGCPYTDPDPRTHIKLIFDLAEKHNVDVDFHLDFDLSPEGSNIAHVIRETNARNYKGRVSIGHVTKLSAMPAEQVQQIALALADTGISLTVLPSTDLFLLGREHGHLVPRGIAPALALHRNGVNVTLATNNVLNPFTPFGDASLIRMANQFANAAHLATENELQLAFDMAGKNAAKLMRRSFGLYIGGKADIVLLDAPDPVFAVRGLHQSFAGWKNGRQTFVRPRATLMRPE